METTHSRLGVVQNESAIDRTARAIIGGVLIVAPIVDLLTGATVSWHAYSMLIAVYPLLTSIMGWDPVYQLAHVKSCDLSDKNRCGTFPFEVASLFGRRQDCSHEYDCHLEQSESKK